MQFVPVTNMDLNNSSSDGDIDYRRIRRIYDQEYEETEGVSERVRQVYYAVRVVYWNPSNDGDQIQYEKDQQFYVNYDI